MSSPAERYAAARLRATAARTSLAAFAADLPFELDPFQVQACTALEGGRGVLVAAPTGAATRTPRPPSSAVQACTWNGSSSNGRPAAKPASEVRAAVARRRAAA